MRTFLVVLSVVLLLAATSAMALADKPDDSGNPDKGRHLGQQSVEETGTSTPTSTATPVSSTPATATATSVATAPATATPTPNDSDDEGERGRGRDKDEDKDREHGPAAPAEHAKKARANGTVENIYADGFDVTTNQDETVRVVVNAETEYSVKGKDDATLADLSVGSKVRVTGRYDASQPPKLVADKVHVVPSRIVVVGDVTRLDKTGDTVTGITVKSDKSGNERTFAVTHTTRVFGADDVAVGSEVTLVGMKDGRATAKVIVVHGADED